MIKDPKILSLLSAVLIVKLHIDLKAFNLKLVYPFAALNALKLLEATLI